MVSDRWLRLWTTLLQLLGFTVVHGTINYFVVMILAFSTLGKPPGSGLVLLLDVWCWVFMFPLKAAEALGIELRNNLGYTFWVLNSILYGLMWWSAWRMWKLFRRKPPE